MSKSRCDKMWEVDPTRPGNSTRFIEKQYEQMAYAYVPVAMTTDTGPETGSAQGCLNCRSLNKNKAEKWEVERGRWKITAFIEFSGSPDESEKANKAAS